VSAAQRFRPSTGDALVVSRAEPFEPLALPQLLMNDTAGPALSAGHVVEVQQQPEIEGRVGERDAYAANTRLTHRLRDVVMLVAVEQRPQLDSVVAEDDFVLMVQPPGYNSAWAHPVALV